MLRSGVFVVHRFNPDLGVGRVVTSDSRQLVVAFSGAEESLVFTPDADALVPFDLVPGLYIRLVSDDAMAELAAAMSDGRWRLVDGREVSEEDFWPVPVDESPVDMLVKGTIGHLQDFVNRLHAMKLERLREADGLGSFLGGRIRLYPHQLHAAQAACATDPVRWLLADGVGLGKTVEACLIMNRLIHTGRAERILVVVPESLTVQWLGELWRKHHHVFVLLDDQRIAEVERDQGPDFNPFEVHRRTIVSQDYLAQNPRLVEMAVAAGIDLLVVDEAHHLQRLPGHAGNSLHRSIAPIAGSGRHVLLLTATPLEDDAFGFMRLVQLLRPEDLPEGRPLLEYLEEGRPLPPCTSATRAADIGGWPERVPAPVDIDEAGWAALRALEENMRRRSAPNVAAKLRKAELIFRASSSPSSLTDFLKDRDPETEALIAAATRCDPRLNWLVEAVGEWRRRGEKSLIFVARRDTLEVVKRTLERRAHLRVGLFHEDLPTKRRDVEVARFRLSDGPSILLSTECGGEGRNFEFCDRLVLFDLPWDPGVVEQRIGRLDRIGRDHPTEVVYFRPPSGVAGVVPRLYEGLGLFRESVGGLGRELKAIAGEIERAAVDGPEELGLDSFEQVLLRTDEARSRVQEAVYHQLHRNRYDETMAPGILARVPTELEATTASVVLGSAARFGFEVEQQSGADCWFIGLEGETLVDRLPGVLPGARFLGTFDREEGVARETIDFFASGHPLVEGLLEELQEGGRGRVACFEITGDEEIFGLLGLSKCNGGLEVEAVDSLGRLRPDIVTFVMSSECRLRRADHRTWTTMPGWGEAVRAMAAKLEKNDSPDAVAAFRVRAPVAVR